MSKHVKTIAEPTVHLNSNNQRVDYHVIQGSYQNYRPFKCAHEFAPGMSTIGPKFSDPRLPLKNQFILES